MTPVKKPQVVYVIEHQGQIKPYRDHLAQAYFDLRHVEAWTQVTSYHALEVEDAVPYVSVKALEALPQTPELSEFIRRMKMGIPEKPRDPRKKSK